MKHFLVLVFLSISLYAAEGIQKEEKIKTNITLGAGPYIQSQPYQDADPLVTPTPVIFFDNSLFYVRWVRVGMYFAGAEEEDYSWGFSITAQPRTFGYEEGDSQALNGMNRDTSWEAGLAFALKSEHLFFETIALHDILSKSEGSIVRAELGLSYKLGNWSFYPSALAIWHSQHFNDYYYGVKEEEAIPGRPAYTAKAGTDFSLQSYVDYQITSQWHTLFNLRADYLSTQIRNSPIVDDNIMVSGLVSLLYSFEY